MKTPQKKLTEFIDTKPKTPESTNKRYGSSTVNTPNCNINSTPNNCLLTSPSQPTHQQTATTPRRVKLTTLQTNIMPNTTNTNSTSPRRVSFVTIPTTSSDQKTCDPPTKKSSPRRVTFTTLTSSNDPQKPRRVALTALSEVSQNTPKIQTNDPPVKGSLL